MAKDLHGQEWRFRHIYRGMSSVFLILMDKSIRIVHGCLVLYLLFLMSRATTTTLAYYWVECICEQEETCIWRCCSVS